MTEHEIGYLIKQISNKMKISADAGLKKHNLTLAQVELLKVIDSSGGQITQKEIEIRMEVSHPTVTGIVSRLEKQGFLKCYPDTDNKRNKVVCTTEKAKQIGQELSECMRLHDSMLLKGLSADEKNELQRMLQIMYQNIEQ
ncbi:MAG: MarR family transcriptional regulator [Lachnospiraceae bacterium]|nr:MarR family transcriptional regulator [Lachnospiraceae bacterium]